MEIGLAYLKALIEECNDPVAVIRTSKLKGERDSEEGARNTLLRYFGHPSVFSTTGHPQQICALRSLGINLPENDTIKVVEQSSTTSSGMHDVRALTRSL